ncbi:MAG TPA: ATP-dependent helicase, partial [Nitratifractor sp.]|nr:ATP-dependent helicase [Nitratifractor sp.]HHH20497.1 ATP-dependent helicase [Nitratifractor sp.]
TSQRYQYIMVDEYQDTNELQYQLLRLLASEHNNLCVVGDDDQSIYGWRGANIRNILEFHTNFENVKVVKLETNYRSTQEILDAANTLIEHNRKRLGKKLVSHKGSGDTVKVIHSIDEVYEANAIAQEIKELIAKGVDPSEIAVLYRINALSRSLEEGFTKAGLAFKLIGGIRFYERAEIKDIISYLRVISNSDDDFSLLRIINKPKRGIGKTSLEKIINYAKEQKLSIFQALSGATDTELATILSKKAVLSIRKFIETIVLLQEEKEELAELINLFDIHTGLREYYNAMIDGFERVLNIDEFFGYFRDAIINDPEITLEKFLADITLQSDQDQVEENAINIMSVHASKGLEFEHLYIIGLEEEFFPLLGETTDIEEERRLAYVAFTRAKNSLTLCYIDSRFYRGKRKNVQKSRFLGESGVIKNTSLKLSKSADYKKGDLVKHKVFGIGRVQEVSKSGKEYKLKINFGGNKKDILSSFVEPV